MEKKVGSITPSGLNPFIDSNGYRDYVVERERMFRRALEKQKN